MGFGVVFAYSCTSGGGARCQRDELVLGLDVLMRGRPHVVTIPALSPPSLSAGSEPWLHAGQLGTVLIAKQRLAQSILVRKMSRLGPGNVFR